MYISGKTLTAKCQVICSTGSNSKGSFTYLKHWKSSEAERAKATATSTENTRPKLKKPMAELFPKLVLDFWYRPQMLSFKSFSLSYSSRLQCFFFSNPGVRLPSVFLEYLRVFFFGFSETFFFSFLVFNSVFFPP